MTRTKPWNRVDLPVYSISSAGLDGKGNMNIITYVQSVSMKPKRILCAVYDNTRTLRNLGERPDFILQLLSDKQHTLVSLLGKKSGNNINKIDRLEKRNLLTEWRGFRVLADCLSTLHLRVTGSMTGGDHRVFICEVLAWKNRQDGNPLTLNLLREKKLIRG